MFYVIEVANGDSKVSGKAIYEYETKDKAVATFHKKFGNAMDSDLYTSELVMVVDEKGNVFESKYFNHNTEPEVDE